MARRIAELDRGRLTEWAGHYDDYLVAREERDQALEQAAARQRKERARVERFIERFRYKASKAKQVQSRVRALERVERVETVARSGAIRFGIPPAPRSGEEVLRFEGVVKRYGAHVVYDGLDMTVRRGQRIALVGPNGTGKSTLLKLASGHVDADDGRVELGHNVRIAYYAQHQLEDLDPSRTALEEIESVADADLRPRLRGTLGRFLFRGSDVDKKVAVLSGGEKARLALAKMLLRPVNLLLLDEPTNHLDLASREVLEDALAEYGGTMIVVSHDRYFVNRIADHVGVIEDGVVRVEPGDYDRWLDHLREREAAARDPAPEDEGPATGARRDREIRRAEAEERNRRYRERRAVERELEPVEREIGDLERLLRSLEARQADPAVYADPEAARAVARDRTRAEERLTACYARWEELAALMPEDG
jgi:ATP-binding cassette subfamily F protein 3